MNNKKRNNTNNGLRQAIKRLNRETNPCVKVAPARSQPNPCASAKTLWVERSVYVQKVASSNSSSATLTVADLSTALSGISSGTLFKVRTMSVWNTTIGGAIKCDADINVLTIGNDTESVVGIDYGSGTSLAGVKFDIPNVISQGIKLSNTDLTVIATIIDPRSIATNQGFVARFSISIQQ